MRSTAMADAADLAARSAAGHVTEEQCQAIWGITTEEYWRRIDAGEELPPMKASAGQGPATLNKESSR